MTREEAKGNIRHAIRWNEMPSKEALDMAIKVLEQEPCEDTISRQAVLDLIEHYNSDGLGSVFYGYEEGVKFADKVKKLPPITSQEPCEDVIRREDAINAVSEALEHVVVENEDVARKMINKLPSVTLQPKQEPCEDVIRREDALQALCKAVHKNDDTIPCSNQIVSCLWSKTKVQDYAREIWKLPPVNPQPKTARWVYKIYGGFHEQGDWYCSHCDYQFNYGNGHAKHCPECGYEMSEAPTEEVKRI